MSDTPFHLTGKNILITGASSGIGSQAAVSISRMGGQVIITGRHKTRLQETYDKLEGEGHQMFVCDLADDNQVKDLSLSVTSLDGVVHCAGIVTTFLAKFINRKKN